ncbi:MAG: hypothetical protein AMK75_01690 [Planctomycetes bacterium SM23_65]|nr:MAG: hypothetical protein AMK75_01690 [Planctomycetes bacterium SM23_65]
MCEQSPDADGATLTRPQFWLIGSFVSVLPHASQERRDQKKAPPGWPGQRFSVVRVAKRHDAASLLLLTQPRQPPVVGATLADAPGGLQAAIPMVPLTLAFSQALIRGGRLAEDREMAASGKVGTAQGAKSLTEACPCL